MDGDGDGEGGPEGDQPEDGQGAQIIDAQGLKGTEQVIHAQRCEVAGQAEEKV